MKTSLGELGRLGRALCLLEDCLERLQGVLDGDDGGVVDGVDHCGGDVVGKGLLWERIGCS